ncbi:MAG: T9SS type A sorting domain-containing protein [Candidatus Cloacimonetes bacterium]|nr:T9SS type A sorting domain-containing protein [Candidatus Cloacimonadota bacterium]
MRKLVFILCLVLLSSLSLFAQSSAEIQWGYFQENSYIQGESVYFSVQVINTGSTTLSGLWLNVDISDPNGTNVRVGWWQDIPTLSPNQTYSTGYDFVWSIPSNAMLGNYYAAVGLRDASTMYDIVYQIDNFTVFQQNPEAEIQWGYTDTYSYELGETVEFNVKVKNIGNVTLTGLWLNVDVASPSGYNVIEDLWQNVPTLDPNETYETGYDDLWNIPYEAESGEYSITVGLRDNSTIYDIEYSIEQFYVEPGTTSAEILWGYIENDNYFSGEIVRLRVKVINTGNTILDDLWLNVDIASPSGNNVVEGFWQNVPTLDPNETYETGYDDVWEIPVGAAIGEYSVTVGLRDNSTIYDIEYGIDQFDVTENPEPFPITDGKIVYHSYSYYWAWDGKLYIYDFSEQSLVEISENWNIDHTINAHFSPDGSKIVFMGVPEGSHYYNSFDVFLWELGSNIPINLTYNNNIPDEDPKFSPSGNAIVFKQNGDLKIMDLSGNIINTITNDGFSIEESMPYYTNDAQQIIYSRGAGSDSDIYIINVNGSNNQPLENVANTQEFYPITRDSYTFVYTKWVSSTNEHDQIYLGYFSGANPQSLAFNDINANDDDPFPFNSDFVFFSSDRSGSVCGWDLYLANINSGSLWSLSNFGVNSSNHELGSCYSNSVTIIDNNLEIPISFKLHQNFPNPFNPTTTIDFSIRSESKIELTIYNIKGQKVRILAHDDFTKGSHSIIWKGNDESGESVSSGVYLYKLNVNGKTEGTKKMLLLK